MSLKGKTEIISAINNSNKIAIMGHKKGDGDSFGSAIALKIALEKIGKRVEVIAEDGLPLYLEFLYNFFSFAIKDCVEDDFDLLIGVDWADSSMAACPNILNEFLVKQKDVIIIDHHVKGKGISKIDKVWSDTKYCATSEMILELILDLKIDLDKNIATALMTGIETDTSSFHNQNTTDSCFAASATLMKHGARLKNIKKGINVDRTVEVLKLWGVAMERLHYNKRYDAAITYLTYNDAKNFGLKPSAINGPVNILNSIKGAKLVILMTEEEPGKIKVSLRTRDEHVDVSKLARAVGGGGHVKAAAFRFEGDIVVKNGQPQIV